MTEEIKQLIEDHYSHFCPHCNGKTNIEGHLHNNKDLSIYRYCLFCDDLYNTLLTINKPSNELLSKISKLIHIEGIDF